MHKLGLGDTKFNSMSPGPSSYGREGSLEYPNIRAVGEQHCCEAEVIEIEEGKAFREVDVERGDIDDKKQWTYLGALTCAHLDGGEDPWRSLK